MPITSEMDLIDAVGSGDLDALIGTHETGWLDFKRSPYTLDCDAQKVELAKDVGAFANSRGGTIVIGVVTRRSPSEISDRAVSVRSVSKSAADPVRYQDVIQRRVFPRVRDLQITWVPPDPDIPKGILVIRIPPQDESQKLFLVRQGPDSGGDRGVFAVPRREGDRSEWLAVESAHALIASGRDASLHPSTEVRHESLSPAPGRAEARLDEIEELQGWKQLPMLAVQAIPPSPGTQLGDFYSRTGLRRMLQYPNELRASGFNLSTHTNDLEVVEGSFVVRDELRVHWLDSDGTFTAACLGTRDWLGHVINDDRPQDEGTVINPLVLVEYVFEFMRFLQRGPAASDGPGVWRFRVRCRRFQSGGVALSPGVVGRATIRRSAELASSNDWTREFEGDGRAACDAFSALRDVYALFGLGDDAIPYSDEARVAAEKIR